VDHGLEGGEGVEDRGSHGGLSDWLSGDEGWLDRRDWERLSCGASPAASKVVPASPASG